MPRRRRPSRLRWFVWFIALLALAMELRHRFGVGRDGLPPRAEVARQRFDRKQWKHWRDTDRDCQDARQEALIAESEVPVTFKSKRRCHVAQGRWRCPFTGEIFTDPHDVDVDHLVPLKNAHLTGAARWSAEKKAAYANTLSDPSHLVVVSASANRAKGAKGPEAWLPPHPEARCTYIHDWVAIKQRWQLGASRQEQLALAFALELCDWGLVPPLPQDS